MIFKRKGSGEEQEKEVGREEGGEVWCEVLWSRREVWCGVLVSRREVWCGVGSCERVGVTWVAAVAPHPWTSVT